MGSPLACRVCGQPGSIEGPPTRKRLCAHCAHQTEQRLWAAHFTPEQRWCIERLVRRAVSDRCG